MSAAYQPPFEITATALELVAGIGAQVGRLEAMSGTGHFPRLRRENRIRSIHASLAIENNTLSLEQVTLVIAGKRVLGPPREILEVKNAFAAYEALPTWMPWQVKDLLAAHRLMMNCLADDAGRFRACSVGIANGGRIVHLAPPSDRVPGLMKDLLSWLKQGGAHPLVAGCVFHYELEFIHPFSDGNGRMGRLWQTLILSRWNPLFAWLPVESVIRERQSDYYKVLGACDKAGNSTAFIEFLLAAIRDALMRVPQTDQVSDQVSDQVRFLIRGFKNDREMAAADLMERLGLRHRPTFRKNYLNPALALGLIEMTDPDSPKSPAQRYRLTDLGRSLMR